MTHLIATAAAEAGSYAPLLNKAASPRPASAAEVLYAAVAAAVAAGFGKTGAMTDALMQIACCAAHAAAVAADDQLVCAAAGAVAAAATCVRVCGVSAAAAAAIAAAADHDDG